MSTQEKDLKGRRRQLRASLWEKLPGFEDYIIFPEIFNKQGADAILEQSRNRMTTAGSAGRKIKVSTSHESTPQSQKFVPSISTKMP